ncbi:MAG: DUF3631 domain-containing protein [Solirubrobacteraceae bacterium]|nr:DUF3631 domain-containing protein [Solirubrobacteraceae bacterium]
MSVTPFERIVGALESQGRTVKRQYDGSVMASCPGPHHDRGDVKPSLHVTESHRGGESSVLVHCQTACSSEEVIAGLGMTWREVLAAVDGPAQSRPKAVGPAAKRTAAPLPTDSEWESYRAALAARMNGHRHPTKGWSRSTLERFGVGLDGSRLVIPVCDAGGETVNVVRYTTRPVGDEPKTRATSGRKRDLFPRPEEVTGERLYVVEGEADALTGAELGIAAVSYPGTKGFRSEHACRLLAGRSEVIVIPDCDDPGRKAAREAAQVLADEAESLPEPRPVVRLLDLDPGRTDGFDLGDLFAHELGRAGEDDDPVRDVRTLVNFGASEGERVFARGIGSAEAPMASGAPQNGSTGQQAAIPPEVVVDPPDTDVLLDQVRAFVLRYVVLPEHAAEAIALWVLHTWAFEASSTTPYMAVLAPQKRAGKSRVLETVEHVVSKPWLVSSVSPAALYRKIDKNCPTLLYDEGDATWAGSKETAEDLRGILNSGYRRSGAVAKCVGKGADMDVRDFRTFGPKMFAGIDKKWPETILDRSVRINMRRKKADEKTEPLYYEEAREAGGPIRRDLEAWAGLSVDLLAGVRPPIPDGLNDRAAECWQPLFAIADLAGGDWAATARAAALALSGTVEEETGLEAKALGAIRELFDATAAEFLTTQTIVDTLNEDTELPFGTFRDGRGVTAHWLGRTLKEHGVRTDLKERPRLDDGTRPNGYQRAAFEEAWARWLDSKAVQPVSTETKRSTESQANTGESGGVDRLDRLDRFVQGEGEDDPLDTLKLLLEGDAEPTTSPASAIAGGDDR